MNEIKICIKNKHIAHWFTLPVLIEQIQYELGWSDSQDIVTINDYEAPFKIYENDDLDKLNHIAELYEDYAHLDATNYLANLVNEGIFMDMESAFEEIDTIIVFHDCNSIADVAYAVIEETGLLTDIPDTVQRYFNYEAYASDMAIEGLFYITGDDIVLQIY
ncbi:antirestriction protein ArdA [Listeria monocytogenes]|nr:antirestriction protein ArdA [Listeria monocytogenes]EAE0080953.1 antirestriction protein ArdA [Listeria monocytogenes]EAK9058254.1 antirestriction protein ArdA [Listeria monocytogenes]ECL0079914.1 antirestriction protein ArdA [Listeria monocytogenes]ECP4565419.1 antirestriction protein ArdA [Listeria monocytogenes]